MVMPSIFRAGTCFMGFRAWNSLENCGDKVLVGRRPGLTWLKQNQASRKTPGPLSTLEPRPLGKALAPRPKVMPGRSVQYPYPQGLLSYRLHPNGLAKCTSHAGHQGISRGPSRGQGPTHYPPSWGQALRARLRSGAWSLGPSSGSSSYTACHPVSSGLWTMRLPFWGAEVCTPYWSLSKASNSYIVAWGHSPYLLAPILYQVDGHCLIVDAFQGQS